jgi:AhpD family alkylhydroperoxidase
MVSIIERNFKDRWDKYIDFVDSVMEDSSDKEGLDRRTKELIAIVVSVINNCEQCVNHHIKKALELGISEKEISDAISVMLVLRGYSEEYRSRNMISKVIRRHKSDGDEDK